MGDAFLNIAVGVLDQFRPDRYRALYFSFVAPDLLAPIVQDAALAGCLFRVPETVPDIGVFGDDAQGDLLASTAYEDRDLPRGGRVQLTQPLLYDGHRSIEVPQPAPRRSELVTVLVVILLEPARADPEYEASARYMVDRTRHICEQVRVPVGVARDERPELYPLRDLSHRPEERPALEVLAFGIAVERVEVVPGENRISPHLLYPEPRVAHLRVTGMLRLKLHPDPYHHRLPPLLANREIMSRGERDQIGYSSAKAAVMTPRVPVRITSPRVSVRNVLSETRVRSAVPSAFPAMAAGMSKSPRGTSRASTRLNSSHQ